MLATSATAAEHHADHAGYLDHAVGQVHETLFTEHRVILTDPRYHPAANAAPDGDR
ncbi:hypothetical protein Gobs01_05036 [Geodermatophilus obscurus DSM 43160]